MDKTALPGPQGEAEGALMQCDVYCDRGLYTQSVRQHSGESSAWEVLGKYWRN